MALPNKTERRAIVDTQRAAPDRGPKLAARMAEAGLYDPKMEFPRMLRLGEAIV